MRVRLLFVLGIRHVDLTIIAIGVGRLQAMIQVEKEVVAAVCDTLQPSDMRELKSVELVK